MIQVLGGYWLPLVTIILGSDCLPVPTGNHHFELRLVTASHWLPLFWAQIGNCFPLVTIILGLDRLPVPTGYHSFGLKLVTCYQI